MRKICVITGSRAEYGLLKWVIDGINKNNNMELILLAAGMHLSPEFGLTINEIKDDGYHITDEVEMLLSSDTSSSICKSVGLGLIGFSEKLKIYQPDIVVLLGDRYEVFSAAVASLISCIPIAHIHGGETTEGAIDEALRHSITKMSHFHFVASEVYKKRVIQLGEDPRRVFNVGGLGIDNIRKINFLSRSEIEQKLNLKFGIKNLLITFHPETLDAFSNRSKTTELLSALKLFKDITLIFTMPNADTNGRIIGDLIKRFCDTRENAYYYKSLGQKNYFSCLNYCDGVLGNSSSGILEVPTFKKGTINIGDRQQGRLRANSVIDCEPNKEEIINAINKLYLKEFNRKIKNVSNPYGKEGTNEAIVGILGEVNLENIIKKRFNDVI